MTNDPKFIPGTAIRKESKPLPGKPWQDDALGSKKIAEKLTNAVEDVARVDVDNAYVIGFHGEWGTGKTFLLQNWCEELKSKEKSPCVAVYYNAWEDDFLANPLVAIIARLQKTMDSMEKLRAKKEIEEKFIAIAEGVSKIAHAYIGVDVVEVISNAKEKMNKSGNTDEVNRYLELRKETDDLKDNLRDVAKVVKEETNFPLVFVVDELDRCRPVFALEVLERVKHLFNVPGVVFVLGFNKTGLTRSIEKVYGYDETQSEKYLRRFLDREVSMPFSSPEDYCYDLLKKCNVVDYLDKNNLLMSKMGNPPMSWAFVPMTGFLGLTLREVESLVGLLLVVLNREKRGGVNPDWKWLILCLMFLKVKNPALYGRVVAGGFDYKDLINEMMEMFCDEKHANPQYRRHFKFCQRFVVDEVYRLADESELENIIEQMRSIRDAPHGERRPDYPALVKQTIESGKERVERVLQEYGDYARDGSIKISVQDITSLIEQ